MAATIKAAGEFIGRSEHDRTSSCDDAPGPLDSFNHAISFVVNCADQAEIDRLWNALSDGGVIEQCGWLRNRYGVSWQIVPAVLVEMMKDTHRNHGRRVTEAMLKMKKLDIADLERAYAS